MRKWITWITLGVSILSAGYDWLRPNGGDAETAAEIALVATMLSSGGGAPVQPGH